MTEQIDELLALWNQLPTLGSTTIWVMVSMCLFATFLARVILQTSVNGLPMLCLGMLAGSYITIQYTKYAGSLNFSRTELMDASIATMIGIAVSIFPVVFLLRVLNTER